MLEPYSRQPFSKMSIRYCFFFFFFFQEDLSLECWCIHSVLNTRKLILWKCYQSFYMMSVWHPRWPPKDYITIKLDIFMFLFFFFFFFFFFVVVFFSVYEHNLSAEFAFIPYKLAVLLRFQATNIARKLQDELHRSFQISSGCHFFKIILFPQL